MGVAQEYEVEKSKIDEVESLILRQFGFILHLEHPHKLLFSFLHYLKATPAFNQEACNLCNDRYMHYSKFFSLNLQWRLRVI